MDANPRLLALTRALADPLPLAVLHRLMTGPGTVSEPLGGVGAVPSGVSNQPSRLPARRLVRALGAARRAELVARGWIVRRPGIRAVVLTAAGGRGLRRTLGVALE